MNPSIEHVLQAQAAATVTGSPPTQSLSESHRFTREALSEAHDRIEGLLTRLRGAQPMVSPDKLGCEGVETLLQEFQVSEGIVTKINAMLAEVQELIN